MSMQRWMILTLLVGGLTGNALTEAASDPPSPMVAVVPIQVQLRALGYDPGPIDGRGGRRTIAALTAYAKDRRIVLNQATVRTVVARLRAEASVMLLDGEATEDSGASGPQGDLQVIPIGRW
jgi:peptidoglycan hydrolase-like protein with peptidoglycan-binding domain